MKRLTSSESESQSLDLISDNIVQARALFPEAFPEGRLDLGVLAELLGGAPSNEEGERFGLMWHGKRAARQMALLPSSATLRPCPEDSVNWDTTRHIFVEGDNLEVLKLLQKSYAGRVKLIYVDPPYNTGHDFVYPDSFKDSIKNYLTITGQVSSEGKLASNPESSGRFHTEWLNMMYPRLRLARNLLRPDGMIFVSIDDSECDNLKRAMSELFGEENHVATFVWKRKAGGGDDSGHVAAEHEYVVCFARDSGAAAVASIQHESPAMTAKYNRSEGGRRYYLERLDKTSLTYNEAMDFPIECPDGTFVNPPQPNPATPTTSWRWGKQTVKERRAELIFQKDKKGEWRIYTKTWEPTGGVTPRSLLVDQVHGRNRDGTQEVDALLSPKVFSNPKPVKLLLHLLRVGAAEPDAVVLDFFAGSGSLGHALYRMNADDNGGRRFILVQLPEPLDPDASEQKAATAFCRELKRPLNIAEITKERLRRSAVAVQKESPVFAGDLGFRAFKLDSSNIQSWEPDPTGIARSLLAGVDNFKSDRSESDILHELLLKLGMDLCVPLARRKLAGMTVYSAGCGVLLTCLEKSIPEEALEPLGLGIVEWHREQMPVGDSMVVFRDSAFANDIAKTNLAGILQQAGLRNIRSL